VTFVYGVTTGTVGTTVVIYAFLRWGVRELIRRGRLHIELDGKTTDRLL
jgi:hypothetical protein